MKKNQISATFILGLIISLSVACSGTEKSENQVSETAKLILPDTEIGIIRGIGMNATFAEVKNAETTAKLVSETPEKLEYLLTSGADKAQILYEFDPEGLYKISVSVKTENQKSAKKLEDDLKLLVKKKYPVEPKLEKNVSVWTIPDKKFGIEILHKKETVELVVRYIEN